jgi:hypothetical protein
MTASERLFILVPSLGTRGGGKRSEALYAPADAESTYNLERRRNPIDESVESDMINT